MPSTTILTDTGYKVTIGTDTGSPQILDQIAENIRNGFSSPSTTSSLIASMKEGTALLWACAEFFMNLVGLGASLIACMFILGLLVLIPMGAYHLYCVYQKSVEREKKAETRGAGEKDSVGLVRPIRSRVG